MATVEYHLFRAKFIRPKQEPLFEVPPPPDELFRATLNERPSAELRKGHTWRIGNLQYFSDDTGYFAVGRTTRSTVEKFDEVSREFTEEELTTSPYTHCVFNSHVGFVGIAKKTSLASTTRGMARQLEKLLSQAQIIQRYNITVEVLPIPDPEGFLRALLSAHQITSFTATFHGPNPLDADAYFQKPLSVIASTTHGDRGKVQVVGENLDSEALADITRSTAATGNEASARIRKSKHQRLTTIHLRGDALKRGYDESRHQPEKAVNDLTAIYDRVRSHETDHR